MLTLKAPRKTLGPREDIGNVTGARGFSRRLAVKPNNTQGGLGLHRCFQWQGGVGEELLGQGHRYGRRRGFEEPAFYSLGEG